MELGLSLKISIDLLTDATMSNKVQRVVMARLHVQTCQATPGLEWHSVWLYE